MAFSLLPPELRKSSRLYGLADNDNVLASTLIVARAKWLIKSNPFRGRKNKSLLFLLVTTQQRIRQVARNSSTHEKDDFLINLRLILARSCREVRFFLAHLYGNFLGMKKQQNQLNIRASLRINYARIRFLHLRCDRSSGINARYTSSSYPWGVFNSTCH